MFVDSIFVYIHDDIVSTKRENIFQNAEIAMMLTVNGSWERFDYTVYTFLFIWNIVDYLVIILLSIYLGYESYYLISYVWPTIKYEFLLWRF